MLLVGQKNRHAQSGIVGVYSVLVADIPSISQEQLSLIAQCLRVCNSLSNPINLAETYIRVRVY